MFCFQRKHWNSWSINTAFHKMFVFPGCISHVTANKPWIKHSSVIAWCFVLYMQTSDYWCGCSNLVEIPMQAQKLGPGTRDFTSGLYTMLYGLFISLDLFSALSSVLTTLVVCIRLQLNLSYRSWKECENVLMWFGSAKPFKRLWLLSSHLSVLCSVERQLITLQWGYLVPPQQILLDASAAEFLTRPSNKHPFS